MILKKAALFLLVGSMVLLGACGQNYSNGERVGVVTKLSEKGLIFNSWEGEMLMALPAEIAGTTVPEKWQFTVDPKLVDKVKTALTTGKRVKLVYRQWFMAPPTIDTQYVIVDVQGT